MPRILELPWDLVILRVSYVWACRACGRFVRLRELGACCLGSESKSGLLNLDIEELPPQT